MSEANLQARRTGRVFPLRDVVYVLMLIAMATALWFQHSRLSGLDQFASGRSSDEMRHYDKFDKEVGDLQEKVRHLEARVRDLEAKGRQ